MYRRRYLKTTGIGGIATILAGCLSENGGETASDQQAADDSEPDPDPTVINTEAAGDFGTLLSSEVDVTVEVAKGSNEVSLFSTISWTLVIIMGVVWIFWRFL